MALPISQSVPRLRGNPQSAIDKIERFNVLGVAMSAMNLSIATEAVLEALRERRKGYVCVTGVHGVTEAQSDSGFRQILNSAFLNTTDGMPLVWLGRRSVGQFVDRVYGPDLMLEVFEPPKTASFRHFFYGGAPGVAEALQVRLQDQFPGTTICGVYCPPFRPLTPAEDTDLIALVREQKPDIIWVGLSTPKAGALHGGIPSPARCHADVRRRGGVRFPFRARKASATLGAEIRIRVALSHALRAPRRPLARRYLVMIPRFLWLVAGQLSGLRKYPIADSPPGELSSPSTYDYRQRNDLESDN